MNLDSLKKLHIPQAPGCYKYFNKKGELIYVGKAVNLRNRILSYWRTSAKHSLAKNKMVKEVYKIKWVETESEIEALLLEANLIKKHQPYYNIDLRDDKRFNYIYISNDEIPGVFLTRKIGKSGKYFGPFVAGLTVKETLKALRKIWPYCTERHIQKKPCFYYQVGRCLGPCGKKVSIKEYQEKVIKPLILFFEGKKKRIIKTLPKDKQEFLKQVLDNTRVLSVGEKYANDVVELAKVLDLPKIPERIEGYDISNIFGKEAVGSIVVFLNGEPDKNEYRKFKITGKFNTDHKSGDVQMLQEIMKRRLDNTWPKPDLIIIDGGKAQVNAVFKILKKDSRWSLHSAKAGCENDRVTIGITKGEGLRSSRAQDKIFFPGQSRPLELSLASPALHLIKRVRDEAHRFAITFHRQRRSKRMLAK